MQINDVAAIGKKTRPVEDCPKFTDGAKQIVESGLSPDKRNAASFAAEFGGGEWGYLAGPWHDFGKYSSLRANPLEHIGFGTVKPFDKVNAICHSSYKCSYTEACNEIR